MSVDYAAIGLVWETEIVHRQAGKHATDRVVQSKDAQIPVIVDLDKFRAEFGDGYLLRMADGSSLRVMAQRVNRALANKSIEERRDAILNVIRGSRNKTVRTTVPVYVVPTPDYAGTVEYRGTDAAEFIGVLVDAGYTVEVAQRITAATMK